MSDFQRFVIKPDKHGFKYEFWRFVFVQQEVEKLAMTAIKFPPMQKGASFNLDAVKAKIAEARAALAK
jgi:arylsulfatase